MVASLRDVPQQSLPLYFCILKVIVLLYMLGTCTVFTIIFPIKVINLKMYIGQRVR